MAKIVTVHRNVPLGRIVQAGEQIGDTCLSRSTGTYQRYQLARPDFKADILQCPAGWLPFFPRRGDRAALGWRMRGLRPHGKARDIRQSHHAVLVQVAKRDLFKAHVAFCLLPRYRPWPVVYLHRQVQHLKDPLKANQAGSKLDAGIGQGR